jgi:PAS domain S-box-containing protein
MNDHRAKKESETESRAGQRELDGGDDFQPDDAAEQKMPAPDLSEAVSRVERHELERRLERLSAEMGRMRKALGSLTRFRTIIDRAGEAIFIIEPDTGRLVDVNETALRWLGLSRDRLLTLSVSDLDVQFPLDFTEVDADHVTDTRSADRPRLFGDGVHRRRDGSSFPVEVAIARRRFADRDFVLAVARECNPRRQAEEELCESEERYRTLFELTRDAIYLTSRDGTVVEVNAAAAEMFGYVRDELIGLKARKLYCGTHDIKTFQERVEEDGFVRELPVTLCRKDGLTFPASLTATLRHTGDGVIGGYQCLIRQVAVVRDSEWPPPDLIDEAVTDVESAVEPVVREEEEIQESNQLDQLDEFDLPDEIDEAPDEIDEAQEIDQPDDADRVEAVAQAAVEIDAPSARDDRDSTVPGFGKRIGTIRRTRRGEVEPHKRAPWEKQAAAPEPRAKVKSRRVWPTVLGFGVVVSLFGWSGLVAASYPFDTGLLEWELGVRAWGVILLSLGLAGREWRRTTRGVVTGLIFTAAVLVVAYAVYLFQSPFGLQSILPDASGEFNVRVWKATQFVAAVVLCVGPFSWFLWRSTQQGDGQ